MLRPALARGSHLRLQQGVRGLSRQWLPQRIAQATSQRTFADVKPDKTVLPGSSSSEVAGIPQPPVLDPARPLEPAPTEIPASGIPSTPPTPLEAAQAIEAKPLPSTNTGNLPPTGTGFAATGPAPPPVPPKPKRRFRRFLSSLLILSILGYAGGVYYSLVSDNFHDFFTEYVPFGEDAVGYFEEREFRRRFPSKAVEHKQWPQTRGEQKVTIGKHSGLSPKTAVETNTQDLGTKGRHSSAVEDNKKPAPKPAQPASKPETREQTKQAAKEDAKSTPTGREPASSRPAAATVAPAAGGIAAPLIDHVNAPESTEPVVQKLIKMVNDIITTVNASPEASKYSSTIIAAKSDLANVISGISELKDKTAHDAQSEIQKMHTEFDQAAKALVGKLQGEMQEQESKWREEYEAERERLSNSYNQRLSAELEAHKRLSDEKTKNSLLEQEIALQKQYKADITKHVEEERDGRLSKLDSLSTSVADLEKLTGEWNSVVDANMRTQHLHVALEAVRAAIHDQDVPRPFLNELVALKEVSRDNELISSAIASIHPQSYQRGIPSPSSLIDRFRRVASEVRKASLLPEDAGVASHAASAVLSRLMFEKRDRTGRGLPEGEDVEAILGRSEVLLEEGRLDEAAREMNGLKGWAGVLSRDWVDQCRRVLEVQQAVDVIASEARLQSLLVQ